MNNRRSRVSLSTPPKAWVTAFLIAVASAAGAGAYAALPGWVTTEREVDDKFAAHEGDVKAHKLHRKDSKAHPKLEARLQQHTTRAMREHLQHTHEVLKSVVGVIASQRLSKRHFWRCRDDVSRFAVERYELNVQKQKRAGNGWDSVALEVAFEEAVQAQIVHGCY